MSEQQPGRGHRIEAGQEYVACRPTPSMPGEHYTRIRVTDPGPFPGEDKALVATVHHDRFGREYLDRRRRIAFGQLHADPARRTGYRLVRHADGSPAGEA